MRTRYLTILLLLLPFLMNAQEKSNEVQAVVEVIENYFDGYVDRDLDQLQLAFDTENGAMKVATKTEDGQEQYENVFFKELIPRWAARAPFSDEVRNNSSLKILTLDITADQMAVAKIEMKIGDTIYIDVLSIQKLNQVWKITNKMFVVE